MSYLIACMLCSFIVGLIFGVGIESSARRHYLKRMRRDEDR